MTVDSRGQVVRDENGLGHYVGPGYDSGGNQTSWRDRRGNVWTFAYDKENRRTGTTSPQNRTTGQAYNARGLLGTITEPSGQATTLSYDGRRRLTSKTDGVGTVSYTLNDASEVTAVTQGAVTLGRTYHASGRVATYTNGAGEAIGYDYDKNGNLVTLTYPAIGAVPTLTVTYTSIGMRVSVKN